MVSHERGGPTIDRLAAALSGELGLPYDRAHQLVRVLFRVLRADLDTAARVVIPGVLVIDRQPEGSKRRHRVRFVLHLRRAHAAAIRRWRDARRTSTD